MNNLEYPREPEFYQKEGLTIPVNIETFEEMIERFNKNNVNFIETESLKTLYNSEKEEIRLEALKILVSAAQLK